MGTENANLSSRFNELTIKANAEINSLRQKNKSLTGQLKATALDEEQRRKYEEYIAMLEKQKNDLVAKHESSIVSIKAEFDAAKKSFKAQYCKKVEELRETIASKNALIDLLQRKLEELELSLTPGVLNLQEIYARHKVEIDLLKKDQERIIKDF